MAGEPYGHYGHAHSLRVKRRQVLHGLLQRGAVVPARDGDDLTVHEDPGFGKAAQHIHDLRAAGIAQKPRAERPVGGVNRDVQRTYAQIADPVHFAFGQIGAGDIVPGEKGQTGVVVLEIKSGTHSAGKLIHKTENAAVGAAGGAVHEIALEVQSEILPGFLAHADLSGVSELQQKLFLIGPVFIVKHVPDLVMVDITELITGEHTALERAVGIQGGDGVVHGVSS